MYKEPSKIAILVSNHFAIANFDEPLRSLANVGNIDVISSDSGKIKSWDKCMKEYHDIVLYKTDIHCISAMEYTTIIIHEALLNDVGQTASKEIISFINKFMRRKKPIIAVCQNEWTIIANSKPENKTFEWTLSPLKISA